MEVYRKLLRRVISHPGSARMVLRTFILKWKDTPDRRTCLECWCIWWQHKHKKNKNGSYLLKCSHCGDTYSEFRWTILENSKIHISVWCQAILEWCICTGSISAAELSRRVGISEPSSQRLLRKIRQVCLRSLNTNLIFEDICELDESWMGKKDNQDIVLGITQRYTRKLTFVCIENTKIETITPIINSCIQTGSEIHSDNASYYSEFKLRYNHFTSNHSKGEFATFNTHKVTWEIIRVHSNTIEHIWWDFKWIVRTIHHGISKKYRQQYLAQYAFRYSCWSSTNLFYAFIDNMLAIPTSRLC